MEAPDIIWDGQTGDFALVTKPGQGSRGGLRAGEAIATAVLIQLFTDKRVKKSDLRFEHHGDQRGWVGDGFDVDANHGEAELGSRLWLFRRASLTTKTAREVEDAAREALQVLLNQAVAVRADVNATSDIVAGRLVLDISLFGKRGERVFAARFNDLWSFFDGVQKPLAG